MRMIAGAILILAATVVFTAYWMGRVVHTPAVSGSPESTSILITAWILGLFGLAAVAIEFIYDRKSV
jgi:hypothetical protein